MSKVQVDKVVNLSDDGAPQLTYGAELPVGYGLTGAGGLNISGVVTAASAVFSGNVTIGGTLTYEDVTNIDVVGVSTFAGRMNVNSSALFNEGLRVTAGVTTISGTSTFSDDVTFTGAAANLTWDKSTDDLIFNDNAQAKFGTDGDLSIYHTGSAARIINNTGLTYLQGDVIRFRNQADSSTILNASTSGVDLYGGTSLILGTGAGGVTISGISTVTTSLNSTGTGSPIVQISNTRVNTGSGAAGLRFVTNEISGSDQYTRAQISAEYDGASNVSGRLILSTTNSSGTLTARLRIDDDGNLGINNSSPDCKLDIDFTLLIDSIVPSKLLYL